MFWRPPSRSFVSHDPMWSRELYRGAAWVWTVLAVGTTFMAWQVPFGEQHDFDIIGFLFLITSIPALIAWGMAFMFAGAALYCWMRAATAVSRRGDPFS